MTISPSVSEVGTSVREDLQLAEMFTKAMDHFGAQVAPQTTGNRKVKTKAKAKVNEGGGTAAQFPRRIGRGGRLPP